MRGFIFSDLQAMSGSPGKMRAVLLTGKPDTRDSVSLNLKSNELQYVRKFYKIFSESKRRSNNQQTVTGTQDFIGKLATSR
jgi:hypothetical protein